MEENPPAFEPSASYAPPPEGGEVRAPPRGLSWAVSLALCRRRV
jgi:hypothetical protein